MCKMRSQMVHIHPTRNDTRVLCIVDVLCGFPINLYNENNNVKVFPFRGIWYIFMTLGPSY